MTEEALFDLELRLLLEALFERYCHDFRHYARSSVRRRMVQALSHFKLRSLSELQHHVLRDPDAFAQLLRFLTVHVSEMFRDPPYFLAMRNEILPRLRTFPSPKIWVAGCSTGEEVYSFAILLQEEGLLDRSIIYATDVDPQALRAAETGIYGLDRVPAFSQNYQASGGRGSLADYFTSGYEGVVFDRGLRKRVVFSDHSLATDGVFAEVQLVSCRNVLIYFDEELQARAVGLFKDALVRGGFLGLGARESLRFTPHASAFVELRPEERIYQRR